MKNEKKAEKKGGTKKKKITKPSGKTAKQLKDQAEKSGRKKAIYYLPVPIPKKEGEEQPMTEAEISYKDKMICVEIERLAAKGLTNDQIIQRLDVSRSTFYDWLKEKPYFSYSLIKYRELASIEVENALFNNAIGFEYKEEQATASGKVVEVFKKKLPETKAQEFWLTNRRSTQWKKKVETTHEIGAGLAAITFSIKRYEE